MIRALCVAFLFITSLQSQASERLKQIIMSAPDDYYVIQLGSYPEDVDFNKALRELNYKRSVVAVKTVVNDNERWVVLEGVYSSADEAKRASEGIKKRHPKLSSWFRSMKSLRAILAK